MKAIRLSRFCLAVVAICVLASTSFSQWVECSENFHCVQLGADTKCGTQANYSPTTSGCPNTGCISIPGGFACNDGTPSGGSVWEEKAGVELTEWVRTRKGGREISELFHPEESGTCAIDVGPFYCQQAKLCTCKYDEEEEQTICMSDPDEEWFLDKGIYDILLTAPESACGNQP